MLKISKLADYGTTVMVFLARHTEKAHSAKEIALYTQLTSPTVSKLLKLLTRANLLVSQRGTKGGYQLALPATQITIAQIISVLDGNIAITKCNHAKDSCKLEPACVTRDNWRAINDKISQILKNISLAAMAQPSMFGEKE